MQDKLLKIINHYGINNQQRKLEEEVFELQEAIVNEEKNYNPFQSLIDFLRKLSYAKNPNVEHIAEELADVEVLLFQIKEYYQIDSADIKKIMIQKINRQLERIENEKI